MASEALDIIEAYLTTLESHYTKTYSNPELSKQVIKEYKEQINKLRNPSV